MKADVGKSGVTLSRMMVGRDFEFLVQGPH